MDLAKSSTARIRITENVARAGPRDYSFRSGRWKVISVDGNRQLFDLIEDPGESTDLSHQFPDILSRLDNEAPPVSLLDGEAIEVDRRLLEELGYLDL
mgnify:FL=1